MSTSQLLAIDPVHGWGWRTEDGELMAPPKPFVLTAKLDDIAAGRETIAPIRQPDHLFDGLWICLSKRDKTWNGMCTLAIFRDRPLGMHDRDVLFSGYAGVELAKRPTALAS